MVEKRSVYPGGNTCRGFHSFYDHMVPPEAIRIIILKGGPGTGKSTLMKSVAADLSRRGHDIEYHWCSSDTDSLDGIVAGDRKVCLLDGTAPHMVEPRYPGAVDYIVNLGEFWDPGALLVHRVRIISLTRQVGEEFQRAYNRLREAWGARWEWGSYLGMAVDSTVVKRNILALTAEFIGTAPNSGWPLRHLFAAALTPGGAVTKIQTLMDSSWTVFAVKGSPGSGVKELLKHIETVLALNAIYAEVFHSPFDPAELDLILIPASKTAILDISGHIIDYTQHLDHRRYERTLDFDQLLDPRATSASRERIRAARVRFTEGIQAAIGFIKNAKNLHDELEGLYIPAMDFAALEKYRHALADRLVTDLAANQG